MFELDVLFDSNEEFHWLKFLHKNVIKENSPHVNSINIDKSHDIFQEKGQVNGIKYHSAVALDIGVRKDTTDLFCELFIGNVIHGPEIDKFF